MLLPLDGMYRLIARRVELRRLTKRQLVLATAHFANGRWTFDGRDRGSALGCIPQYSAATEPSSFGGPPPVVLLLGIPVLMSYPIKN